MSGHPLRRLMSLCLVVSLLAGFPSVATAAIGERYMSVGSWPRTTWQLRSPRGVAMDDDGNTYVADTGNDRVVKFDAEGKFVVAWGGAGADNGKFRGPYDVAVTPDGKTVYVADTGNNRVQWFTVDGGTVTYVDQWGRTGSQDYTGSNPGEFQAPRGIALDSQGKVYVVDTANCRIQKFDPETGQFVKMWGTAGSDINKFYEPWAIDVAPDDTVYVLDRHRTNCYVRAFDTEGEPVDFPQGGNGWGARTDSLPVDGLFRQPEGITVDDDGNVYVSDTGALTTRIQKFTYNGVYISSWGFYSYGDVAPNGQPAFRHPAGMDAVGSGANVRILVGDPDDDRVREFSGDGQPLTARDPFGVLGSHGVAWGRYDQPWDVEVASPGAIYVADRMNHRVQRLSLDGSADVVMPGTIGMPMPFIDNARFDEPSAIAYDPASTYLFVAEAGQSGLQTPGYRVQRLTADLEYSGRKWGNYGTANGQFKRPQGIAVGASPDATTTEHPFANRWVYVSDTDNNRVQVFDLDGNWKANIGVGLLKAPAGITVESTGRVWVVDSGNRRIVQFTHGNDAWTSWTPSYAFSPSGGTDATLVRPWGIDMDDERNVYITDVDAYKVKKYSSAGVLLTSFGERGAHVGQFEAPRGLAVNGEGVVYVADTGNHRIQALVHPLNITISGVTDGAYYRVTVTPTVAPIAGALSQGAELDGDPWTSGTPISAEGEHVLRVWGRDLHGYVTEQVVQFTIDRTAPTTLSNALGAYNDQAVITLTGIDELSGVRESHWNLDSTGDHIGTTVLCTAPGPHSLKFWSVDRAGNPGTQETANFIVTDTLAPSTTSNLQPSYVDAATISLTSTDGGSGTAHTYYSIDGKARVEGTAISTPVIGAHTLQYCSVDAAGNWETTSTPATFTVLRRTAISISKSAATIGYGGTVTIKGALRDKAGALIKGKSVKLWRSLNNGASFSSRTLSSTTGYYSCTDKLSGKAIYYFTFAGDSTNASVTTGRTTVGVKAYLGVPVAPTSVAHGRTFVVTGLLKPQHAVGSSAVKLMFYQYVKGKGYVYRKYAYAQCLNYYSYSKYRGYTTLPYVGSWRVRAYHADTLHVGSYSAWEYLTVR